MPRQQTAEKTRFAPLIWKEIIENSLSAIEEAQRARLLMVSYTGLWKN